MAADYKALKEGGFMRQVEKDKFSLRLRVTGGALTAGQLAVIADVSRRYGRGRVHLTSRQGLEIPFIRLEDTERVKAALTEGGVPIGVCGPRVRTVTACQGSEVCPSSGIETQELARELADRYFGRALPHKFKFGVTGCVNNCLKAEENDLGIKGGWTVAWSAEACTGCGVCLKACREGALTRAGEAIRLEESACVHCGRCVKACPAEAWSGAPGYLVFFGGLFGNQIARGRLVLPLLRDKAALFRAADATLAFFDRHGRPGERFRAAVDRAGWDLFKTTLEAA